MLTLGSLRPILAAALETDARVAPVLEALQCAGLLPGDEHAALDTGDVATVIFGLLANVPTRRVADEVLRLADFRVSGTFDRVEEPGFAGCRWHAWSEQRETVREMLTGAIDRARSTNDGFGTPLQLRFLRGSEGDCIVFEARSNEGIVGVYALDRYVRRDLPIPSASALTSTIENRLSWLLIAHLAEELGPLPEPEADNDNIGAWAPIALPTPRAWN